MDHLPQDRPSDGPLNFWDSSALLQDGPLPGLNFPAFADDGTLSLDGLPTEHCGGPAGEEEGNPQRKRSRQCDAVRELDATSLEMYLAELASEPPGGPAASKAEEDEEAGRSSPLPRPASDLDRPIGDKADAGRSNTKAQRERQRRERLNESFLVLAHALDGGKQAKADKSTVISDAIKAIAQLRAENGQLKMMVKLLEDRLRDGEKERVSLEMTNQRLMEQLQHGAHGSVVPNLGIGVPGLAVGQPLPVTGLPVDLPHLAAPGKPQQEIAAAFAQHQAGMGGMVFGMHHMGAYHSNPGGPRMMSVVQGLPVTPGVSGMHSECSGPSSLLQPSSLDKDGVRRPPAA